MRAAISWACVVLPASFIAKLWTKLSIKSRNLQRNTRALVSHPWADPNALVGEWDVTRLSCVVAQAPLSTVKLLFVHVGSTAYRQLMNFASNRTDSEGVLIMQYLLNRGASTNDTLWENRPDLVHWAMVGAPTPLHGAAAAGNVEAVRLLLKHSADRTKRSVRSGKLPIDVARACKNIEIANILAN